MNIHFIQHETFETAGAYLNWAKKRKYNISFSKVFEGDKLPDTAENIDMLIVLGGPQSPATSMEEYPYFDAKAEMSLIKNHRCRESRCRNMSWFSADGRKFRI